MISLKMKKKRKMEEITEESASDGKIILTKQARNRKRNPYFCSPSKINQKQKQYNGF